MAKMVIILFFVVLLHSFELSSVSSFLKKGTKTSRQPKSQKEKKNNNNSNKNQDKKAPHHIVPLCFIPKFHKIQAVQECVRGNHALRNVF